jgi:transposase InsO family protein
MDRNDLAWTAFRASLLAPLLTGEVPSEERGAYFQKLAQETHLLPGGQRKTISLRTLRRWYQHLCQSGIEGLKPQRRSDRGQPRRSIGAKIDRAVALKLEQPRRSDQVINRILKSEFGSGLASSTLYRHLRIRGATRRQLGIEREKVRCTWTRDVPNALWMGDFSHGPIVLVDGRPCQTHLSAWIDSHSRYVVDARYYLRENLDILIDSLLRAWAKHGSPRELYADNGKVYHAQGLVVACAQLQIVKLHRPPREPEPGGLIERFFQTVQSQLEAEVRAMGALTLQQLNQAFEAWLQSAYHCEVHSSTHQTPQQRYCTEQRLMRPVSITEVEGYFYRREQRRVDPTYSDVSIDKRLYQVDPKLRSLELEVQFDPFRTDPEQPDEVKLYSLQGIYLGIGKRYQRERGAHRLGESIEPKPLLNSPYIEALLKDHQRAHEQARQGIDYKTAMQHGRLSMAQFAGQFSHNLGRSGLSSLSQSELGALEAFYAKYPQVRSWQVPRAFELAAGGGFNSTLWHLQSLLESSPSETPTGPSTAPDNER